MDAFNPPRGFVVDDLEIRPYGAGDGPLLLDAINDARTELDEWIPWVAAIHDLEEAEATCLRYRDDFDSNKVFRMMAIQEGRMVAGPAFLCRHEPLDWRVGEVGMWVRTSEAGKGFASRLLAIMLEWGFSEWGWKRLSWHCDTRNLGSVRVAEKNGLKLEGTLRQNYIHDDGSRSDTHIFAILREEWEACHN